MTHIKTLLAIAGLVATCSSVAGASKECPVTSQSTSASTVPEASSLRLPQGWFWYGSSGLWTRLPTSGEMSGLRRGESGVREKLFWWSKYYQRDAEPVPALEVVARRLDAVDKDATHSTPTNASAADIGTAMLTTIEFPSAGCWAVEAQYAGQTVRYVVQVSP